MLSFLEREASVTESMPRWSANSAAARRTAGKSRPMRGDISEPPSLPLKLAFSLGKGALDAVSRLFPHGSVTWGEQRRAVFPKFLRAFQRGPLMPGGQGGKGKPRAQLSGHRDPALRLKGIPGDQGAGSRVEKGHRTRAYGPVRTGRGAIRSGLPSGGECPPASSASWGRCRGSGKPVPPDPGRDLRPKDANPVPR